MRPPTWSRPAVLFACTLGLAASAHAATIDLGDGLVVRTIVATENGLDRARVVVARGDVEVPLEPDLLYSDLVLDVRARPTAARDAVDLRFSMNCQGTIDEHLTRDELMAMTEARRGAALLAKGDRDAAIAALLNASALVPSGVSYRVSAMQALVQAGRREEAAALGAATPLPSQVVLSLSLHALPELAPLLDDPRLAAWRRPGLGSARALPAYDPVRQLVAVATQRGNAMAENAGYAGVALLDAPTGEEIYWGASADAWLPLLAELGFDAAVEEVSAMRPHGDRFKTRFETAPLTFVAAPKASSIMAGGHIIGSTRRPPSVGSDGIPLPGAALFHDVVLLQSQFNIGDGCGAENGSWFVVVPFEKPGPPAWEALRAASRARRALTWGHADEALAALAAAPADEPVVIAWRALADARAGHLDAARDALARLPSLWAHAAADDPAAVPELRDSPALAATRAATPGTATGLPAWDPVHRVLAFADPVRDAVRFEGADGQVTLLSGMRVTPAFLRDLGFVAPLGEVAPTGASEGYWRAVGPDPSLRLVCDSDEVLVLSRAGRSVASRRVPCVQGIQPKRVWFFGGATLYVSGEPAFDDFEGTREVAHAVFER